jgi:hypothetical protein
MNQDPEKINRIQQKLKKGKGIIAYNNEELRYLQKPLGKAIYKNAINQPIGRPRKSEDEKAKPDDRIICDICQGVFTRAHRSAHKKTKVHQAYEKMNGKIQKLLLDEDD